MKNREQALYERKKVRVVVDHENSTITFTKCFYPSGFWTLRSKPEFTCDLGSVCDVREMVIHGEGGPVVETHIITDNGKALLHTPKPIFGMEEKHKQELKRLKRFRSTIQSKYGIRDVPVSELPAFVPVVGFALAAVVLMILYLVL